MKHGVNDGWQELARVADDAQAEAIDDALVHLENIEPILGPLLVDESRRFAASLRSRRNELRAASSSQGRGHLEAVAR